MAATVLGVSGIVYLATDAGIRKFAKETTILAKDKILAFGRIIESKFDSFPITIAKLIYPVPKNKTEGTKVYQKKDLVILQEDYDESYKITKMVRAIALIAISTCTASLIGAGIATLTRVGWIAPQLFWGTTTMFALYGGYKSLEYDPIIASWIGKQFMSHQADRYE